MLDVKQVITCVRTTKYSTATGDVSFLPIANGRRVKIASKKSKRGVGGGGAILPHIRHCRSDT